MTEITKQSEENTLYDLTPYLDLMTDNNGADLGEQGETLADKATYNLNCLLEDLFMPCPITAHFDIQYFYGFNLNSTKIDTEIDGATLNLIDFENSPSQHYFDTISHEFCLTVFQAEELNESIYNMIQMSNDDITKGLINFLLDENIVDWYAVAQDLLKQAQQKVISFSDIGAFLASLSQTQNEWYQRFINQ